MELDTILLRQKNTRHQNLMINIKIGDKEYKGKNGQIVDVTREGLVVKVKDGSLLITDIKIEGKGRVLVKDYLNGIKDKTSLLNIVLGDKNE